MENSSLALYMAGSLLIALLVVSLLVYAFNNIGSIQDEKDRIAEEEEITRFNAEYEAFDKSLMYGVDVLSCINKAISHNEHYVTGGRWSDEHYVTSGRWSVGNNAGMDQSMQVIVNNVDSLEESFVFYRKDKEKSKYRKLYGDSIQKLGSKYGNVFWDKKISDLFKEFDSVLKNPNIDENTTINDVYHTDGFTYEWVPENLTMQLLTDDRSAFISESQSSLYELVGSSSDMQLTAVNTGRIGNPFWDIYWRDDNLTADELSHIEWNTILYSFKKKTFRCSEIQYNENTGKIDCMIFEAINN